MLSMLTKYEIMKLGYHPCLSLQWWSNCWYTVSFGGALPFFFLRLRWLRLTVNRGLALALINPQLTPIICSVCQGPLLMRLFNFASSLCSYHITLISPKWTLRIKSHSDQKIFSVPWHHKISFKITWARQSVRLNTSGDYINMLINSSLVFYAEPPPG